MYRVWYCPQFHASTGGLGKYPSWIRGHFCRHFQFLVWHLRSLEVTKPVLTIRKNRTNWKSTVFLRDSSGNWGCKENHCLQNRDKHADTENQSIPEEKPRSRNRCRNRHSVGDPKLTDELLEAQCGQAWELKTLRWPPFWVGGGILSWVLPPGSLADSHNKGWRKISLCFWQKEREVATLKYTQSVLLS